MHKRNLHAKGYDLDALIEVIPELKPFVFQNDYGTKTIDFANPKAVKLLNQALLKHHYRIKFWEFGDEHLCPPIPGRVDYIHLLKDLLDVSKINSEIEVLDIGTGATCIYPLLGNALYQWKFIATEIDIKSLKNAKLIVDKNELNDMIELRHQLDSRNILNGIIKSTDAITVSMCNPPFYKSQKEAEDNTKRKLRGLKQDENRLVRNFSGTSNELWYAGGEKAFLHNYLFQSSLFKTNCLWFTSLVSKKELIKDMKRSLKKLRATSIKVLELNTNNKVSRVLAWTFTNEEFKKP